MDTRKTLRWLPLVVILGPVAALIVGTPAEATVDIHPTGSVPNIREPSSLAAEAPVQVLGEAPSIQNDAMVQYLYDSMRKWTKVPDADADPKERHTEDRGRYAEIAADIVTVVRSERPAFVGDTNRSRTAVLVAGVAFWESAFLAYVDKGLCNDWVWRHPTTTGPAAVTSEEMHQRTSLLAAGSCDGGWAYSDWQIHTFDSLWRDGLVLLDDAREWSFASYVNDGQKHKVITGKDMIADRQIAARVALHMLRRSLGRNGNGNLCGYTGEGEDCWKGALRLNFAKDWAAKHPFAG